MLCSALSPLSKTSSSSSSSMASTTLLQHPRHDQHPLEFRDLSKHSISPLCHLCNWKILADGYSCEECKFYAHRVCAEAPPRIDLHPLHTDHPLTVIHHPPPFISKDCKLCDSSHYSMFRCDECDFNLDIRCALSTLLDRGGSQGKIPEQIMLPLHPHTLTSISTRHDFIGDSNCVICNVSVEGDGYACLNWQCEFLIHKRCIQDLYYTDGIKAPQVYHRHPLETFRGEDTGSRRCAKCGSKSLSGEFIGCAECQMFCCRDCVQVSESIQYPSHPDHNLVLFIHSLDNDKPRCDSCSCYLEHELCYGCPSCEFFVDISCALQVLSYCEKGMSTEIKLSWHQHPLHLCHRTGYDTAYCYYCEEKSAGPMYACKEKGCIILLHKRCTEIESTIICPHHPDHPLTLCDKVGSQRCEACSEIIYYLKFFCELDAFYLHAKCVARFPTRKHYFHEHKLLHLDKAPYFECNRCDTFTKASLFRCVPCNFNLHEECMELPKVVKSKIHWHPLTLHETFVEDDSGEYYCEHCEKTRDPQLGVYVCGECKLELPRIYHIECVLPELGKVYEKKIQTSAIKKMAGIIAKKRGQVSAAEEKQEKAKQELNELKRELDELMKENAKLISGSVDPEKSV